MKTLHSLLTLLISLALILAVGCKKNNNNEDPDPETPEYSLGWFGETEDPSTVPSSTNFGFGSDNLPDQYDIISEHFPPIGNQGNYGTCVAWAVGYNAKTVVNGLSKGYGASDLSQANKQFSPRDLFTAIDDDKKGDNCGGTNFSFAMDVVQNRGVATLATAPYPQTIPSCSQSALDPAWTQEAAGFKFKWWRKIDASVESIKKNISQNVPVIFGARLADNFMSHNTDDVISSATSYDNVGQHAYHAMIIGGYDDNKGPNGAFRVVNSWGTSWGGNGYVWVDYNFFFSNFVSSLQNETNLYIAANDDNNTDPPDDVDPNKTGVDLAPWIFEDVYDWDYPWIRYCYFNIYNIGNQTANPEADWSFYYIYFNAYNADDYGIIFYDEFNTSVSPGVNGIQCDGNHCVINIPIDPGNDMAYILFQDEYLYQEYEMPEITGDYYLLALVDAGDVFQEQDELNNLFYPFLWPLYFYEGVEYKTSEAHERPIFKNDLTPSLENLKQSKYNTIVTESFRNAYTPEEIKEFLKKEKRTGRLDEKIIQYKNAKSGIRTIEK